MPGFVGRRYVRDFEFENQPLRVRVASAEEAVPARFEGDLAAYIAWMIRTGNYEWDVIRFSPRIHDEVAYHLGDLDWARKYLVDFGEVPGFAESHKSFITEDPHYRSQTGGIHPGPYLVGNYYILLYDARFAEEIGIEVKQHAMTGEDLISYLEALQRYNDREGANVAGLYYRATNGVDALFHHLAMSALSRSVDPERAVRHQWLAALDHAFEFFERLSAFRDLVDPSFREDDPSHGWRPVSEHRTLFWIGPTWRAGLWLGLGGARREHLLPAELPALAETDRYVGSYTAAFAVFSHAPARDAAIQLMLHISSARAAEDWVRFSESPTGLRGNLVSPLLAEDPFAAFRRALTARYGGRVRYTPGLGGLLGTAYDPLNPYFERLLVELLRGETDAQAAGLRVRAWIGRGD
jgi:hypothetical protein